LRFHLFIHRWIWLILITFGSLRYTSIHLVPLVFHYHLYVLIGVSYWYCNAECQYHFVHDPFGLTSYYYSKTLRSVQIPSRYVFVRTIRDASHLTFSLAIHWITWLCSTFPVSIVVYIIANGIPIFNGLVSLIGGFLGTFHSFLPMGCMRLDDHWRTIHLGGI